MINFGLMQCANVEESERNCERPKPGPTGSRAYAGLTPLVYPLRDWTGFDDETCRLEPIANPFGPKVLPMSPE